MCSAVMKVREVILMKLLHKLSYPLNCTFLMLSCNKKWAPTFCLCFTHTHTIQSDASMQQSIVVCILQVFIVFSSMVPMTFFDRKTEFTDKHHHPHLSGHTGNVYG